MCEHEIVIRDGFSDTKACKVTLCRKCLEISKIEVHGEKPKPKPPAQGTTIGRMSVLKAATDIEIQTASLANISPTLENVFALAEKLEAWVFRPTYE